MVILRQIFPIGLAFFSFLSLYASLSTLAVVRCSSADFSFSLFSSSSSGMNVSVAFDEVNNSRYFVKFHSGSFPLFPWLRGTTPLVQRCFTMLYNLDLLILWRNRNTSRHISCPLNAYWKVIRWRMPGLAEPLVLVSSSPAFIPAWSWAKTARSNSEFSSSLIAKR